MNRPTLVFALAFWLPAIFSDPGISQVRADPTPPAPRMLERPEGGDFEEPKVEPGREVVAFEMAWQKREPQEVARRLQAAIVGLLGEEAVGRLSKQASYDALRSVVAGDEAGSWVRLADAPILVRYDAQYDEIRVLNEELDLIEESASDLGVEGAREVAEHSLKQLAEAGVIDPRLYRQAAIQVGYKVVGEGALEQEVKRGRVVGYRVTYRPRLHGFQLANAGLRLGINASGEIASLRVGGVSPQGQWRGDVLQPTEKGGARDVRTGTKELMERFYRQVPKGVEPRVAWSRVMYVMPEGESRAVLEPMLLVSYTEVRQSEEGPVASRRKTLGYSLTNPEARPLDFDAPAARHEGIEPTREN